MKNPYDVLGVRQGATPTEVHSAWRRLAEVYAPARHTDAPPEVQAEAARRLAEVNAAYLATQGRSAQSPPPSVPVNTTSVGKTGRRRVTAVVAGIVLVCGVAGGAVVFATRSDPPAARETSVSHAVPVAQWLGTYHKYVDEIHAKWVAGPNMQTSTLGQQEADAMHQSSQSYLQSTAAMAQMERAQAAQTSDPVLRDRILSDAAQREADGQKMADAFDQSARASGAMQEFCGNMISLLRDQQGPLFPSPNRELDRALGAWIDATVAYWGTCPLLALTNAEASNRLASEMQAKQSAVTRLVGELGR